MKDIQKLADVLNAAVILLNSNTHAVSYLDNQPTDTHNRTINLILANIKLLSNHQYQSLNSPWGHILTCQITNNLIICFSFDYSEPTNELIAMHSLSNLKSIAQIVYKLYNGKDAPDTDVIITKFSDKQLVKIENNQPFDATLFFNAETDIIKAIIYSHNEQLTSALEKLSYIKIIGERFANNNFIRGEKNTLISYIAVLNRAIIQWGYPVESAFRLHNDLVQEVELSSQFSDFFQVIREVTWRYFNVIKNYRVTNFLPLHERIHQYIKEHITESMTLDDIATRLNASKKLLNPAFKNEYGITITQFIRQVKIDAAKELLIASDLTLLDISNLLSFSTTTYFVKTFKEITGLTPKYFRQHFFDQHPHL
ncbi:MULTISPECIES: helix-turn-helix domain-containing protein [Leuconostoc gelidum group]|uniref:AraC family transcriptional regulator n=1 Tax=Leuconostoc gelidum subsp. gelidum TaxID=1607839 RepID=A0AB35G1Y4_LEUGE|nr:MULTISPECIES: AraC family transcriptional regulator [Leuconostoc gelidum group]MBZ5960315.1 AraC family transcriptional regulator [Leuconostoc gasicomitatum]MBZ5968820.1 AraC family transcriptional regulator [Leuconostoc gasicomitatum]MBZ6016783.1 AraC family transcriptional regulator [Leuconostoc gelidum subsp. gelidum]